MKINTAWQTVIFAVLSLFFITCDFETDGKFTGQVAGMKKDIIIEQGLQPPVNVQAVADSTSGGIRIIWEGSDDADGYTVYRSSTASSINFARRGSSGGTVYIDKGASVPPGTPYYYYVTAYNNAEVSKQSNVAGPVWAELTPGILEAPEITKADLVENSKKDVIVEWTTVAGSTGYYLYRASAYDNNVFIFRYEVSSASFEDKGLMPGSYFYQVRAFDNNGEGYVSLPEGPVIVEPESGVPPLPAPSKPQNLNAVVNYPSESPVITVTWGVANNAKSYTLYRSVDGEHYTEIGNTSSASYTDNTVQDGEAYYYRVRGYNDSQEGYLSDPVGPVLTRPGRPVLSASVSDNTVIVEWPTVYGADIYYVYRSNNGSEYQLLTSRGISETSYSDLGLSAGTYYYQVEASNSAGRGLRSGTGTAALAADAQTPVINVQPVGNTYLPGVPASPLTVQASVSDGGTLSYQWYANTANSNSGGDIISGATNASYTPPTATAGTVYYYVLVTNTNNSVNGNKTATTASNTAAVVVGTPGQSSYTVIFNSNGGSEVPNQTINSGGTASRPENPTQSDYFFVDWYSDSGLNTVYNFSATVTGDITLYAKWSFVPIIVPEENLADQLSWLQTNAVSGGNYIVEVNANEIIDPTILSYSERNDITITLIGTGAERIIDLSSNGALFTIDSPGLTLILDNNITLKGRSSNNSSLVRVDAGTLVMNTGSRITGNSITSTGNYTGGSGVYVNDGNFNMTGGEISGNTIATAYSYNGGGGVYVYDGNFTMSGGKISGNSATGGSNASGGGGVYIHGGNFTRRGTFTMNGGEISNNTGNNGGGVYVYEYAHFTMHSGVVFGNTAVSSGGGVYTFGPFTIHGGAISGNTARSGGGMLIVGTTTMFGGEISGNEANYSGGGVQNAGYSDGTFRIVTGTIYGSDEAEGVRNICVNGGVALEQTDGPSPPLQRTQRGTFNGDTWISTGRLTTTSETIRVVDGVLK